jgi:hypothetical protein
MHSMALRTSILGRCFLCVAPLRRVAQEDITANSNMAAQLLLAGHSVFVNLLTAKEWEGMGATHESDLLYKAQEMRTNLKKLMVVRVNCAAWQSCRLVGLWVVAAPSSARVCPSLVPPTHPHPPTSRVGRNV